MASMKDYDVLLREKTDSEIRNYFPITKSANVMVATNKTLNDVIKEQEVKNYETYIGLKKLNNIEDFAEVNQNAYSKIKFGFKSVSAKNKTDTLSLAAGNNISIDSDENDNIIISSTYDEVPMASEFESGKMSRSDYIKLQGIESYANNYIHPKSGVVGGLYGYVRVDDNGHVIEGMKEALPVELGGTGVKSYEELEKKLNIPVNIPIDDEITANGKNPVSGAAIYDALKSKANVDHGLHVPSISGETNDGITFLSNNNTWGTVRVATTDKTGVIKLSSDYDDVLDGVVLTPEAVRSGDDKVIKYVDKKFTDLIGNASESLDTIYELAEAAEKHEELLTRVDAAIGQKVDKVEGKGLSTNDYTTEDKNIVNNASSHMSNNNNPHNVTKAQIGLENVTNDKQIKGLSEGTTKDHVVTFGEDGYTVKDSGYSIKSDVPENAKFTDTTYSLSVDVDENKYPLVKFINSNNDENRFSIYGDDRLKVTKDAFGNIKIDSSGIKYNEASETGSGFMSQADYIKLQGIEEGANKYVHPTSGVVASTYLKVSVDKYGHVISGNNDVIKVSEGGTGANNAKDALVNLGINATTTEINYLSGLMNNVQDQLDYKVGTDVFNKHTHPQYSTTDHTHSEYATSNHSHPQYSITNHTHPQYSITNHTHSEYATSNHTHSEYATTNHTHSEYAASNHTHTQYLSTAGGTLSGDLKFTRNRGIVQYMATPSNYNKLVSWYNEESNTLIGQIGYHNHGESIAIVPYQTTANPWEGRVGLSISKNHAVLDGKELLTEANYSDYAASKEHTHTQYLSTADISVTNISYTIPANTAAGWRKIARISLKYYYPCFDLYTTGNWYNQDKSTAHFQITERNGRVTINQISGFLGNGIARIRMVKEDKDIYVLEEYSQKIASTANESYKFIIIGCIGSIEPLNGVIETNDDSVYKDIVTSDVVDIPNGYSINSGNISSQTVSKASSATYADNAAKVNGHTVNSDVPANAKFTDTNTWRPLGTTADTACAGNDSRLSNARPASDVSAWAKASTKPTYTASEVGAYTKTETDTKLNGKANSSHTHSIANITNLQSTLDGKAASNHTHTQYLSTAGGAISNRITRDSGGSFISDRNRVAVFGTKCTKSNYNPIVGQKTKNGAWTIGNLGGNESLFFNYSTDENFNANNNSTSAVLLPAPNTTAPSEIITSATIGSQTVSKASSATYSTSAAYATKASTADYATSASKSSTNFIIKDGNNLLLRTENANFTSGIGYDKKGEECLALWAKSSHTALRWYAGADMSTMTQGSMMDITPDLEITKPNGTDSLVGRIGGSTILTSSNQGKVSNNINKYLPINGGIYLFIDGHVSTDSRFTWHEYNVTYATNGLLHCNDDASGPYITNNSGYKLTFEVKIGADGGYTQYGYGTTSGSLPSYQHSGTGRESFAVSNTVTAGQIFKFSVPNGKNFFFGCGGGSIEYIKISEVMMESVNYAPLIIKRTGSTYAAGIKFYNNNGALGSIAMFGTANGGLYRYLGDESNCYLMMDTSNIQSYAIPYETDSNNIFAIKAPSGKDGSFVRVPSSAGGLIPYERGTIGSGHSYLGTESWYFSKAYIDDVYAKSYHTDSTIRYGNAGAQFFSSCASSTSGTKTVAVPIANKWYHILRMNHADNSGYFSELAFPLTDTAGTYNHMAYRTVAASRERTWRTLLDSSNYSSYALPKSGGTMSGGLNINVGSGYPFTINNLSGDSSTEVSMVICSGSTPYWCIGKGVGAIGADLGIWNNRRSHVTLRIRSADDVIVTNYPLYAKYFRLTDNLWSMGVTDDSNNMSIYPNTGSGYGLGFYSYSNPTTIIRPQVDNYLYLGHASYRFAEVRSVNMYISAGTAVTSDRRYKNTINELDEELSNNFIMSLKPSSFKYNDGESGRLHYGLIAQDVEDAMKTNNISSQEFAGLIIEKLNEPIERDVLDNDGNIVINEETGEPQKESYLKETGEIKYDLRYEEFIAPMIKVIQKQNREIEDLRNEISELKELITQA